MNEPAASISGLPDPLQMLALAADKSGRFELNSVSIGANGRLDIERPAPPASYRFRLNGLTYSVRLSPMYEEFHYLVTASLGHIPFTAESREARGEVLEIVRTGNTLQRVRFHIGHGQELVLLAENRVPEPAIPEAILHEMVLVIQEAQPFIVLLGDYLVD